MTEREKIAQIIAEHMCPLGKVHKLLWGAEKVCYSRQNFAECDKVCDCVDALIAAGIGDVTEWKEKAKKHRVRVLPDGTIKQLYSAEEVEDIDRQREDYKHRAEVAERALLTACVKLIKDEEDNVNTELLARVVYTNYLRKAEKELAEEKNND